MRLGLLAPISIFLALPALGADDALLTVAEKSDFKATARYSEVVDLCRALADKRPGMIRLDELGKTGEGRSLPMMIVADPPVSNPEEAARSGKLVVLIIGDIHAGEVCGKEALPILVRELTDAPGHPLLKDVILLAAPIYNADGNERVRKDNRPGQVGPEDGMGQRANAAGLDLNRDFVKLEAPETRGLVRTMNRWDPHLFLDLHTTNGSHHRYLVTYQGPLNPGGDQNILKYVRDTMFPEVSRSFKSASGQDAFFYGNFDRSHSKWMMYGAQPRFGTTYVGMRNRIGILSEAYSYAPYKDRIFGTRDFVVACLQFAVSHKAEVIEKLQAARRATVEAGRDPKDGDKVAIRSEVRAFPQKVNVLGFVEKSDGGRSEATSEPRDYVVDLEADFAPTLAVTRPFAYLVPPKFSGVIANLQRHGIEIATLREEISLDVEVSSVDAVKRSARPFQGHHEVTVEATTKPETRKVPAGTLIVKTAQPLGSLAVQLLEPQSEDGLTTWNYFDDGLVAGAEFPVLRLPKSAPIWTAPARPLPGDRPIASAPTAPAGRGGGGRRGGMGGGPGGPPRWIAGDRLLQTKDGLLLSIDPETGRGVPFLDRAAMARGLSKIEGLASSAAEISRGLPQIQDPTGSGGLYNVDGRWIYASFDGLRGSKLPPGEDGDELHTFSPNGKLVAFVRKNDLYVVEVDTGKVRRLTEGGTDKQRNGKADWVYYEELFNRNHKAFWWSPDSARIAYLQLNDAPVRNHPVLNDLGARREVEETPYPRSGEPNPFVKLGIVAATGGSTTWADLSAYPADSSLVSHVGWWPDGKSALAYAQDRTQTYLDMLKISVDDGKTAKVLRDTTGAWVESPGDPHFLDDGSFLLTSERDGFKHLYHFGADGSLKRRLTTGDWEISAVLHADASPEGWVFFSANRDMPLGGNLYRVRIKDGPVERLTLEPGEHRSSLSPSGKYALDTWSDVETPPRTRLLDADGRILRTVDLNPPSTDSLSMPPRRRFQIKARDGYLLEAELITPTEIDPRKVYPVWFMTYGGPHNATVSDGYANGRTMERALAAEGFVVFRMDPRSASTKGVKPTWTAYKHLGVQEMKDVEDAINWLKKEPYVDGSRIGMSGHSYGGYLTAYCMTHSDLFAAGIAGAPVTDWRDYDSIYTERYMLTPQENPEGYNASSVVRAAGNLHGRLLILHGLMDDNVSIRNTVRLVDALQRADKDFEMMIYPPSRHGIGGAHYQRIQRDFIHRLGGPKDREPAK